MLQAEVRRRGRLIRRCTAVNDVVVSRGALSRIIQMTLYINGERVTDAGTVVNLSNPASYATNTALLGASVDQAQPPTSDFYRGILDEVGVYDGAFDDDQAQAVQRIARRAEQLDKLGVVGPGMAGQELVDQYRIACGCFGGTNSHYHE